MEVSEVTKPADARQRVTPSRILVAGCALFALSVGGLIAVDVVVAGGFWSMLDLQVYDWGGQVARHSGNLYGLVFPGTDLFFTYPPMAAAVFSVLSYVPLTALKWASTAGSVTALTAVTWLTWGALGYPRSKARLGGALATAAVAIGAEPVQQTLGYGQVNIVLMLLVVADLTLADHVRWKGIGVGLAAGFKLTALIFVPYLLLTRRFRAAGVALATFLATIAVFWPWLPAQSDSYWVKRIFMDSSRIGNNAFVGNQSLRGMVLRLAGSGAWAQAMWALAVVIVVAAGLLLAMVASRRGQEMAGILLCALTGLLISPVSWTHHWVWVAPALVLATDSVIRARGGTVRSRRTAWAGLLALLVVFWSRLVWAEPESARQGQGMSGLSQFTGSLYVWAGLATLGLAAVLLARQREAGQPAPHGHDSPSAAARTRGRPAVSPTAANGDCGT